MYFYKNCMHLYNKKICALLQKVVCIFIQKVCILFEPNNIENQKSQVHNHPVKSNEFIPSFNTMFSSIIEHTKVNQGVWMYQECVFPVLSVSTPYSRGIHHFKWTRKINPDSLFTRSRYTNNRWYTMQLEKQLARIDTRKYFFRQRE